MSKQKQVVYNAVVNSCDHPSAETVLLRSKAELPSINLATIYRNLKVLVGQGLVNKISQDEGDRFDKTLCAHAHFKCTNCGSLTDLLEIDVESIKKEVELKYNFKANETNFVFKGVCSSCINIQTIN